MKTFAYRGFDLAGRSSRGLVEALDLKEAREKLSDRGVLAERIETAEGAGARRWPGQRVFGLEERAVFYRELAAMLRAGLPLVPALEILIQSPDQQRQAVLLAHLRDRIREGGTLAASLGDVTLRVTPFETAVLAAGTRAGNLDVVLDQLGGYLDDQLRLRDGILSAVLYPVLVVALGLLIAVVMLGFVLPNLGRMFSEGGIPLPLLTRALLWAGQHFFAFAVPLLAIMAGGVFLLVHRSRRDRAFRIGVERAADRVPLFRRGRRLLAGLRFTRTLALLLRGGVSLVDALELAGESTASLWVSEQLRTGAEAARHGKPVSQVVRGVTMLGDTLPGWFEAGEASGDLSGLLEQAAARFQQQWDSFLSRMLKLVEPLLILAVGVFVLLIALAILLPILSLNRAVL